MQVHKEAIDKIPNSLPNRTNVEVEIYGMDGIPDKDVKEHEILKRKQSSLTSVAQNSDSDDDDELKRKSVANNGVNNSIGLAASNLLPPIRPPPILSQPPLPHMSHYGPLMNPMNPLGHHYLGASP